MGHIDELIRELRIVASFVIPLWNWNIKTSFDENS